MKKMGRPKSANPKNTEVMVRINDEQKELLKRYCSKNNVTRAEAIRTGINKLKDDLE